MKESATYKRDIVAIDEIKKDRDIRIKMLRDEIEKLTLQFQTLSKDNALLIVKHDTLDKDHIKL